jgi:hypothetical protein
MQFVRPTAKWLVVGLYILSLFYTSKLLIQCSSTRICGGCLHILEYFEGMYAKSYMRKVPLIEGNAEMLRHI